mmetsp:Transcript_21739/g.48679  ORF Transcript_21739/g.48679 Transcript_21739/m.48679 type:complete len:1522 (+) Transcript_21739:74-4639(+)
MATEDPLIEELFGDFNEDELAAQEGAAPGTAASAAQAAPGLTTEDEPDDAADLFGDFDEDEEAAPARRLKRLRPEAQAAMSSDAPQGEGDGGGQSSSTGRGSKRRRRVGALDSKFYELEAEEAAGSGDEEEDGDLDDFVDQGDEPEINDKGRSRMRRQMMQSQQKELEEVEREATVRANAGGEVGAARVWGKSALDRLEEKYRHVELGGDDDAFGEKPRPPSSQHGDVDMRGDTTAYVVPDPKDPKLWSVKTFAPERELCISLMLKSNECMAKGIPIPIFSVFFSPHLRGYVYIEAFKESDVRSFIKGIRGLSPWMINIVPQAQMHQVFTASVNDAKRISSIKVGDWVRMKRGPNKGDLGQIRMVKDEEYMVMMKPRLQAGGEAGGKNLDRAERAAKRRPPPRWFNRGDLEAGGTMVEVDKVYFGSEGFLHCFYINGNKDTKEYYRDGFLLKTMRSTWFAADDKVRPQEHELQEFRNPPPISENTRPEADLPQKKRKEEDRKLMPPPLLIPQKEAKAARVPFAVGDVVIVVTGDLKNLRGEVRKANFGAEEVLVRPLNVGVSRDLMIGIAFLHKYFEIGDYVKAVNGPYQGDAGFVVSVNFGKSMYWDMNTTVTVLSTSLSVEFTARIDDIRLSAQRTDCQEVVGEFSVGQLVAIDIGGGVKRGVIVRLEANSRAVVLGTDGRKHILEPADFQPVLLDRKYKRMVWAHDRNKNPIKPGDVVRAPHSQTKAPPILAEVLFIHENYCFVRALEALSGERSYLVCQGGKCEFVWKQGREDRVNPKKEEENKEREQAAYEESLGKMTYGITMASQIDWVQGFMKKTLGISTERGEEGDITEFGTPVRIISGDYKGLRGEIRDFLGEEAYVSLLCKPKLVKLKIGQIAPDVYAGKKAQLITTRPAPAPQTPREAGIPIPTTPVPEAASAEDKEEEPPNDDNCWDPNYLASSTAGTSAPGTPSSRKSSRSAAKLGTATPIGAPPSPIPSAAAPEPVAPAPAVPRKPKRQHRLPPAVPTPGDVTPPTYHDSMPPFEYSQSPSASPNGRLEGTAQKPWLIIGVGVMYTRDGSSRKGWISKVYENEAHIVPEDPQESGIALKDYETRHWAVEKRGDEAIVFDGPRRGSKGKVQAIDKDSVYLRVETGTMPKGVPTSRNVQVKLKDVARYGLGKATDPSAAVPSSARSETASEPREDAAQKRPRLEAVSGETSVQSIAESLAGAEQTPDLLRNMSGLQPGPGVGTPFPTGDRTPAAVTLDLDPVAAVESPEGSPFGEEPPAPVRQGGRRAAMPTQGAASPFVVTKQQGGETPAGDATPGVDGTGTPGMDGGATPGMEGGATPAMGGATPWMVKEGYTTPGGATPMGGATPRPGGATPMGGATPALGGVTPLGGATPGGATPLGFLTPGGVTPGGATPMKVPDDISGSPGVETPRGAASSSAGAPARRRVSRLPGAATPVLPAEGAMVKKGEETPGGFTLAGDQTPWEGVKTPGGETPGAATPGMAKREGAQTPVDGERTPIPPPPRSRKGR